MSYFGPTSAQASANPPSGGFGAFGGGFGVFGGGFGQPSRQESANPPFGGLGQGSPSAIVEGNSPLGTPELKPCLGTEELPCGWMFLCKNCRQLYGSSNLLAYMKKEIFTQKSAFRRKNGILIPFEQSKTSEVKEVNKFTNCTFIISCKKDDVSHLVNNFNTSKNQFDNCIFNIICNDDESTTITITDSSNQQSVDEPNPQES